MAKSNVGLICLSWFVLIVAASAFFYFTREVSLLITMPFIAISAYASKQAFPLCLAIIAVALAISMNVVVGSTINLIMAIVSLMVVRAVATYIHLNVKAKWGFRRVVS